MKDQKVFNTGVIVNSALQQEENPFINFQTSPPDDASKSKRHYFEVIAATTEVNLNGYKFEPAALIMLAEDFKNNKTLTINHMKGNYDNVLGFGGTVDAIYLENKLYVAAYISLDKTYPNGPFGTSEELRDGIVDGFINSVSQSALPIKAKCSVCNLLYPTSYGQYKNENICKHYRGEQVITEENGQKVVKTVHVKILKASAVELSLVQMGADTGSGIHKKAINLSLNDFVDEDRFNFLYSENNQGAAENSATEPNNEGENSSLLSNNQGESKMSQETINALQLRAETAEASVAKAQAELNTEKGKNSVLESQKAAVESQVSSLEAEKTALESQVETITNERDALKEQLNASNESITEKDKELAILKQEAAENAVIVADGKAAREEFETAYVEAFVKAIGDDCTKDDEELQAETAKSFTIATLKKKIEGFEKAASDNYAAGKKITEKGKKPENGEESEETGNYPIGV